MCLNPTPLAMGIHAANFLRRLRWVLCLVVVNLWMTTVQAAPKTLRIPPDFELNTGSAHAPYTWRNASVAISLALAGRVSIASHAGRNAHITFVGASSRSAPRGEAPSARKTFYYLGPIEEWRTASHFERVRYKDIYPGIDLVFVAAGNKLNTTSRLPLTRMFAESGSFMTAALPI